MLVIKIEVNHESLSRILKTSISHHRCALCLSLFSDNYKDTFFFSPKGRFILFFFFCSTFLLPLFLTKSSRNRVYYRKFGLLRLVIHKLLDALLSFVFQARWVQTRSTFFFFFLFFKEFKSTVSVFLSFRTNRDTNVNSPLTKSLVSSGQVCCFSASFPSLVSFVSFAMPLGMVPLLSLGVKTFVVGSLRQWMTMENALKSCEISISDALMP